MKTFNTDLISQAKSLESILGQSATISEALGRIQTLNLPNWYLGAGCIAQTVWNYLVRREFCSDIRDLDLAYFDQSELSYEGEHQHINRAKELLHDLSMEIDVKNQARVHLWHKEHQSKVEYTHLSCGETIGV